MSSPTVITTSSGLSSDPETTPIEVRERAATLGIFSLVLAIGAYILAILGVLWFAFRLTHNHLVYALDDTYIHMAIAKNLAAHGTFGVTSHEFSASSSSIIWPFLLAVPYKIFGPAVVTPLLAQIVFGVALLWLCWRTLRDAGGCSDWYAASVLVALMFVLPMPALTYVGMEHLLHALVTIWVATLSVQYLHRKHGGILTLLLSAALLCSVRYEGAFLIAAVALLFARNKRFSEAVAVSISGAVPIVLFGLYSRSHGAFFLPNSLILKGRPLNLDTILRLFSLPKDSPEMFALVIAALLLLAFGTTISPMNRDFLKLFCVTALIHHLAANYGWFYRYEAYLVGFGLIAVATASYEILHIHKRRIWVYVALAGLFTPLIVRGVTSIASTPSAMADIYHQHIQMARFFSFYYPGKPIVLNDIGAVSFYADPRLTDIFGLGSTEVTRIKAANLASQADAAQQVLRVVTNNRVEVAAIYDDVFGLQEGVAPPGWVKVGEWNVPGTPVLIGRRVSFYGIGYENAERLRADLAEFHSLLPIELQRYAIP